MKEQFYLLHTVTNSKNIPLEYSLIKRKRDMRFKFCKVHDKDIIDFEFLAKLIHKHNMEVKPINNFYGLNINNMPLVRIIAPNGKTAYEFYRDLNNK